MTYDPPGPDVGSGPSSRGDDQRPSGSWLPTSTGQSPDPQEEPDRVGDALVDGQPVYAQDVASDSAIDPVSVDDVPASLELAYTPADMGLGPRAYDRAIPYERVEKRRRGARTRKVARELVETVILALLIFFAVRAVVQNFRVEGASMEPSMHNDQYLLVNKAIYYRFDLGRLHDLVPFLPGDGDSESHLFRAPKRGDIVVFRFPLGPDRDFIKRVIGVPGDVVEIRDEKVFINGVALEEDYILSSPNYTYGPREVPEGKYFVLGDNRRNSYDSHAWSQGCAFEEECEFVPEENIIGMAWISYWPFDELGLVNNKDIEPQAAP